MSFHYFSEEPFIHGKYFRFEDYIRGFRVIIVSSPGVFSSKRIDKGTRLLVEHMIIRDGWRILDLGTGYGIIGIIAAKLAPNGYVIMTDINKQAIKLARMNLKINNVKNAEVRWGDLYEPVRGLKFDTIVCNPPISAGLKVCSRIIEEAPNYLNANGLLQIVARHNKGGRRLMNLMEKVLGNVEIIASEGGYRVYVSRKLSS